MLAFVAAIGMVACSLDSHRWRQVNTTRPRTASGERVLRVELELRQSPEIVWKAFATEEGLRCWVAPVVHLDLRTDGALLTNYDKNAVIGGPGTISLAILNYVESQEITFKVKLNNAFSAQLQHEDGRLQEVVELQRQRNGGTKVVSSMVGWGTGDEWDKAFEFFARGNEWSYKNLAKCFSQ
ncbi:MAG TPA: SRPBCC domain-containing protein [Thermoanaerobaculia bacterium]|nr:SRPBCC domain-containing protein [Thermoanaerobaculia bacterium]